MKTINQAILTAGDMSQATLTSSPVTIASMGYITVSGVYTGSPTGTLKLQCSLDSGTNWIDIPSFSQAISAAGSNIFELKEVGYHMIRAVYTKTSGTGSLLLNVNAKGF